MRFRNAVLLALVVVLAMGADGARDRSRKKNRDKGKSAEAESAIDDESRRGFGESEGLSEKARERNRERERERERGMETGAKEKEEESSEEKDDDKKEKNATDAKEIVVLEARLRRSREFDENAEYGKRRSISNKNDGNTQLHRKSTELNDGKHIPLNEVQDKRHHIKHRTRRTLEHGEVQELDYGKQEPLNRNESHSKQRSRRTLELVKAAEINDGEEMPLEKRPTQTHQYRVRRWPGPGKQTHHGRAHRKLRVRDKKKTMPVVKQHRVMRIRRAEKAEEHNKENEEKKHQTQMKKESSSSQSQEKKQRRVRSLVTRELVPKGYPPYETQSEETMERDKTLKSLYPSQFF